MVLLFVWVVACLIGCLVVWLLFCFWSLIRFSVLSVCPIPVFLFAVCSLVHFVPFVLLHGRVANFRYVFVVLCWAAGGGGGGVARSCLLSGLLRT